MMSAFTSVDIREVVFVNEQAKHDYESMPAEVLQAADARTTAIQIICAFRATSANR